MNLEQIMAAFAYKVEGGAEFQWNCYPNARYIDFAHNPMYDPASGKNNAHGSVLFSTVDQTVYEANVTAEICYPHGARKDVNYRWINPEYREAHDAEAEAKGVKPNLVYEDTNWTDLDVEEDFLEKATAIFSDKKFDERVLVPVELEDELIVHLAMEAHKRDITMNKMIEVILQQRIDAVKNNEPIDEQIVNPTWIEP
jgi:hypothetical protein